MAGLVQWQPRAVPLVLGSEYDARLERLEASRQQAIKIVRDKLEDLEDETIFTRFDERGRATDEETREWTSTWRSDANDILRRQRAFNMAGLGKPDYLADYEHWGRSAFFELREVVFLSVGLEPHTDLIEEMAEIPQRGKSPFPEAVFLMRRADQLSRQFDPHGYSERVAPEPLFAWINKVSLQVHPGFDAMLSLMVERDVTVEPQVI
ncbi:hypothetical protein [Yoonia sp. R2-816]|uniref:hypothetical protein n=1 Tax=Yoonia sp. R2-816 TaxID=3342638 RepID=UPI003728412D